MSEVKIKIKICSKCGVGKPVSAFSKDSQKKDGLQVHCKSCKRSVTTVDREIDKNNLLSKGLIRCSKCKLVKPFEEFNFAKDKPSGYRSHCKECTAKKYIKNKTKILKKMAVYRSNNKENIAIRNKIYGEKNREKISNKDKIYRINNREKLNSRKRDQLKGYSKSEILLKQLPVTDNPLFNGYGFIEVTCYFCHKSFTPTVGKLNSRINCLKGSLPGEGNFYCSDSCRKMCPTFKFQPYKQIDPRSKLYIPKTEAQDARAATKTAAIKKAICDKYGELRCEMCGQVGEVELHHTLPVAQFGMESVNPDSFLMLCHACHVKLHGECRQ